VPMVDDPSEGTQGSLDPTKSMRGFAAASGGQQLNPGDVLGGRFTVIQFLARGAWGRCTKPPTLTFRTNIGALKMLHSDIAADPLRASGSSGRCCWRGRSFTPTSAPRLICSARKDLAAPFYSNDAAAAGRVSVGSPEACRRVKSRGGPPTHPPIGGGSRRRSSCGSDSSRFQAGNVMLEGISAETRVSITDFGLSRAYQSDQTLAETGRVSGPSDTWPRNCSEARPLHPRQMSTLWAW